MSTANANRDYRPRPRHTPHCELLWVCMSIRDLHEIACTATGSRFLSALHELANLELRKSDLERALAVERGVGGAL